MSVGITQNIFLLLQNYSGLITIQLLFRQCHFCDKMQEHLSAETFQVCA